MGESCSINPYLTTNYISVTCGTEPFTFHLSPQKWKCQKSPHLYEFYVHKQIIFEGQSSYRFLERTFIKISNSFSEAVNNGERGLFWFSSPPSLWKPAVYPDLFEFTDTSRISALPPPFFFPVLERI